MLSFIRHKYIPLYRNSDKTAMILRTIKVPHNGCLLRVCYILRASSVFRDKGIFDTAGIWANIPLYRNSDKTAMILRTTEVPHSRCLLRACYILSASSVFRDKEIFDTNRFDTAGIWSDHRWQDKPASNSSSVVVPLHIFMLKLCLVPSMSKWQTLVELGHSGSLTRHYLAKTIHFHDRSKLPLNRTH